MSDDLRGQIALLRQLTPKLNAVTDEAADLVREVEAVLNEECKLGLAAYSAFDTTDWGDGSSFERRLEYGRLEGKFRLFVSDVDIDPSDRESCRSSTPWANCTRGDKLMSIVALPGLLARLADDIRLLFEWAPEATGRAEELLRGFRDATQEAR